MDNAFTIIPVSLKYIHLIEFKPVSFQIVHVWHCLLFWCCNNFMFGFISVHLFGSNPSFTSEEWWQKFERPSIIPDGCL